MNSSNTEQKPTNTQENGFPDPPHHAAPADTQIPARQRYVHLYMPLITVFLIFTNGPILSSLVRSRNNPGVNEFMLVAVSAIPTYLVGSLFYPANRPPPTPTEEIRFTRKSYLYRGLVIATYGRIFGTPFNLQFVIADLVLSYAAGAVIGERPVGTPQRRSEFFNTLLWLGGSWVLFGAVPHSMFTLYFLLGIVDRTVWRAAYLALVDDVIKVLSRPNTDSLIGKVLLVLVQSFVITALVWIALAWTKRMIG